MKQQTLGDMEYSNRKKKTKREEFLEIMEDIIPWDEWTSIVEPIYPTGKRGRPPVAIETILRMYLLQVFLELVERLVLLHQLRSVEQRTGGGDLLAAGDDIG